MTRTTASVIATEKILRILVDIDGVLKSSREEPIAAGIIMVGSLSAWNEISFMTADSEDDTKRWLDTNKIVDYDRLMGSSLALVGDELSERQINHARSRGSIELFITNSPITWAYAFDQGIPSVMFGVPSYTRPEFRPDAPKKVRAWDEIERAINEQNAMMTQDARISREENMRFGD